MTSTPTEPGGSSGNSATKWPKRRIELRSLNQSAWDGQLSTNSSGKLDTSLKRHTTLLTRLKSSLNSTTTIPSILTDIKALSLEKYIEEIVGASFEGLTKCKTGNEVVGAIEVISALHQRFPNTFTPPLNELLLATLKPSPASSTDKDKEDSITRQRNLLRILGELEFCAIVVKEDKSGKIVQQPTGEITWSVLKELLTAGKDQLTLAAPLAIAFTKHLGSIYLPSQATTDAEAPSEGDFPSLSSHETSIIATETKDKFRKLLLAFLEALGRKEGKSHIELQKIDKRNHEAYIKSGEVFEDREKGYEKLVKAWERGWSSVAQLSDLLAVPVPVLPSLASTTISSIIGTGTSSFPTSGGEDIGGANSLWIDEEDQKFYCDLRELKGEVPPKFLGIDAAAPEVKEEGVVDGKDGGTGEGDEMQVDETAEQLDRNDEAQHENPTAIDSAEAADTALATGPAAQLTALFTRLADASSKNAIDSIAVEFAFLNSKAARKRLVRFLGSVNRNRQDILPYYARLVGTLNPYMPDIGKDLVILLEEEFRYLQRKKQADMAETRSKNLKFFSELTKFKVTPIHSILHVFKVLLDDFTGPNIDNLCTVLEGCGRFLLRSEATSEKMRNVLETLKRKKAAMNLDQRQVTMLENAYYQCDPPDRPALPPKERIPMQLYIRHLFYNQLTRNNVDRVAKLVRKLHWEDPAIVAKLFSAFTKVWKIKFSNVHLFAILLDELERYHPDFVIAVIDEVLEDVRIGMEINNFKLNQQRIATIKYLGEMYNYRVVDSRVIFDTLWSLVTFAHLDGRPHLSSPTPLDMPDDSFRIRLVCTLLDTCGSSFDRGNLKKKLDAFLVFFQLYVLSKEAIPMDVNFMLDDTFEQLRPKMVRFEKYEDAEKAADEKMKLASLNAPKVKVGEVIVEEEAEEDEEEGERAGDKDRVDLSSSSEGEEGEDDEEGSSFDDDDDEDTETERDRAEDDELDGATRRRDPNAMTEDEEDEFSRELAKMMAGTGNTNVAESRTKSALFDVGVPVLRKNNNGKGRAIFDEEEGLEEVGSDSRPKGMTFTLLTKKGSKQQTRSMEIPLESSIAVHTLEKRAQDKAEQQELKKLVLDYEQREEVAEKQALKDEMARRGVHLKFKVVP